jgi:Raf kinase inhibitor-like YbhB/YbcL family protein
LAPGRPAAASAKDRIQGMAMVWSKRMEPELTGGISRDHKKALNKSIVLTAIGVALMAGLLLISTLRARWRADLADGQTHAWFDVSSSSFANGNRIPARLTCRGANLSPAVEFSARPVGTKSFAIVMDDSDSPFGYVHWIVYNIPGDAGEVAEGASSQRKLPAGASEGLGSADTNGYGGPCPPGNRTHRYLIRVYALDLGASLSPGMTKQQLAAAVKGHVLAEGQLTGLYGGGN